MKKIEVRDLHFAYSSQKAVVDGLSFDIEAGEYISILGHNGSGKSTLAKLLMGLLNPKSGEILIDGEKLDQNSLTKIRSKMALVFQNPDNQFIGSTVEEDVAFGLENRQIPQAEMHDIIFKYLKLVGMDEFYNKEPSKLSGGQKQRVAIAGILALSPEVIIFDEATSMLDPKGKREIRECINELRKENPNLTIISITHDIEEAFSSDEVLVLSRGKLLAHDKPENILKKPEIFDEAGIDLPFKNKLINELAVQGININDELDLEGVVKELCR